jgi:hypothetical protein
MTPDDVTPHVCDSGNFDRTICPDPCGMMHSYCATCGKRQDRCAHDTPTPQPGPERVVDTSGPDPLTGRFVHSGYTTQAEGSPQPAPDERVETVARALLEHRVGYWTDAQGWEWAACSGCRWGKDGPRFGRSADAHPAHQAAAVVAALGDETARLREWKANAEITLAEDVRYMRTVEADLADARAALDRVRALFAGGPDTSCRAVWRWSPSVGRDFYRVECVEVPLADLRAALDPEEPR